MRRRLAAALLAAPLLIVVGGLTAGAFGGWFGPSAAPVPSEAPRASALLTGLPRPDGDYAPDEFHLHVNGAADGLIAGGCTRLLAWQLSDPAGSQEVLVFASAAQALERLRRDAGDDLTAGPGDAAVVDAQSVFFTRGRYYARLFANTPAEPGQLVALAERLDCALVAWDDEGAS